jgi:hypothetical protein
MKRILVPIRENSEQVTYKEIQNLFELVSSKFEKLCASSFGEEQSNLNIPVETKNHSPKTSQKISASVKDFQKRIRETEERTTPNEELNSFLEDVKEALNTLTEKIKKYQDRRSCMVKEEADTSTDRIINGIQSTMNMYKIYLRNNTSTDNHREWAEKCYNHYIEHSKILNSIIVLRNVNNRSFGINNTCQPDILSITRELQHDWEDYNKTRHGSFNDLRNRTRAVQLKLIYANVDDLVLNSI